MLNQTKTVLASIGVAAMASGLPVAEVRAATLDPITLFPGTNLEKPFFVGTTIVGGNPGSSVIPSVGNITETRTVTEFSLAGLSGTTISSASLFFDYRYAETADMTPGYMDIYSYEGDGFTSYADAWAEGSSLLTTITAPGGAPTTNVNYSIDITSLLQNAIDSGFTNLGFNFRIGTQAASNQAAFNLGMVGLPDGDIAYIDFTPSDTAVVPLPAA